MEFFLDPQMWMTLFTLTFLEIVLGVDNIVFISILAGKLPERQQPFARKLGLAAALITRLLLLASLTYIVKMEKPLFALMGHDVTGKDLVLILGGLFLLYKSMAEIRERLTGEEHDGESSSPTHRAPSFAGVIVQIMFMDIIFSLDSIITAVGMSQQLPVMMAAVILAVIVMMVAVEPISYFIKKYPTIKMLAIAFLVLIGGVLVLDGFGHHLDKKFIYFAIGFSMSVEILNISVANVQRRKGGAH